MKYRTNAFTLMEVILSITLIGIIATVISMRGREIFLFYKQQSNIEMYRNQIELTEQVARLYDCDIDLYVEPTEKGLILRRSYFDQPRHLDLILKKVTVIDSVTLYNENNEPINDVITYHFSRNGSIEKVVSYRCQ